mmetsp:Transcript_20220/g.51034  ORF Transcript_20220/g.51034 Transcript_20220/m.51034 type:complete len:207 (+) Transcript_20220:202-822(+)
MRVLLRLIQQPQTAARTSQLLLAVVLVLLLHFDLDVRERLPQTARLLLIARANCRGFPLEVVVGDAQQAETFLHGQLQAANPLPLADFFDDIVVVDAVAARCFREGAEDLPGIRPAPRQRPHQFLVDLDVGVGVVFPTATEGLRMAKLLDAWLAALRGLGRRLLGLLPQILLDGVCDALHFFRRAAGAQQTETARYFATSLAPAPE